MSQENKQFDPSDPSAHAGDMISAQEVKEVLETNHPNADQFAGYLAGLHEGVRTSKGDIQDSTSLLTGLEMELHPDFEEFSKQKLKGARVLTSAGGIRPTFDALKASGAFEEVELPSIDEKTGEITFGSLEQVQGYFMARDGKSISTVAVQGESHVAGSSETFLTGLQELIDTINKAPESEKLSLAVRERRSLGTYVPVHLESSLRLIVQTVRAGETIPDMIDRSAEIEAREAEMEAISQELDGDTLRDVYHDTLAIETERQNLQKIYQDHQTGRIDDKTVSYQTDRSKQYTHEYRMRLSRQPQKAKRVNELMAKRDALRQQGR